MGTTIRFILMTLHRMSILSYTVGGIAAPLTLSFTPPASCPTKFVFSSLAGIHLTMPQAFHAKPAQSEAPWHSFTILLSLTMDRRGMLSQFFFESSTYASSGRVSLGTKRRKCRLEKWGARVVRLGGRGGVAITRCCVTVWPELILKIFLRSLFWYNFVGWCY